VEERSGGRVKFTMEYSSGLYTPEKGFEAVGKGIVGAHLTTLSYSAGMDPRLGLCNTVMIPKTVADFADLQSSGDLYKMIDEAAQKNGVKVLMAANIPPELLMVKDRPVTKLEDVKGLKVRAPGILEMDMMNQMGAAPMQVVSSEIYVSLQKGALDAAVAPMTSVVSYKLNELIKYITDFNLVYMSLHYCINLDQWNSFPADIQAIFVQAAKETVSTIAPANYGAIEKGAYALCEKSGVKIVTLADGEAVKFVDKGAKPAVEAQANRLGATYGPAYLKAMKDFYKKIWGKDW
jgi:TRAP-type C4-dicarboxylate transport system substrate-binding protein